MLWTFFVDPVCGASVDPASAAADWTRGRTVLCFCSVRCFNLYVEDLRAPTRERPLPTTVIAAA
jgi:YHS domain-containing protein